MARINGSGFKMKQSPTKGLSDFFNNLGDQLKRGTERRIDKKYEDAGPNVRKQMLKEGYAKPTTELTDEQITATRFPEAKPDKKLDKKPDKKITKITGALGSKTRKEQYDAKGWRYDDTIEGYNRDGTEKKKKKAEKTNTKKDIIRNKIEMIDPSSEILDTLDEIKAHGSVKNKDVKKGFDFNKTNDYSPKPSAANKRSGFKMKRNK